MTENRPPSQRRIGQLAGEMGLNPRTIRYYEALGLLPAPSRTAAGYRLYSEADRERLQFIARAKAVGLTLSEIGGILRLHGAGEPPCAHVSALLDRKIVAVDRQLHALSVFRRELVALRAAATEARTRPSRVCGILEQPVPPSDAPPAP